MATSVETLFGDIIPTARQQMEQQQAQGLLLAQNLATPGFSAAMDSPRRNQAIRQSIGGLLGVDTRTGVEREQAANQELFQRISNEAQQQFPNDRTAQLNFLADQLQQAGKLVEAQKARALAQESQLQGAKIGAEQALTTQRTASAMKDIATMEKTQRETLLTGLGDATLKDFEPASLAAYQQSVERGLPDPALLVPRDTATPSDYEKALMAAYPNDPAKRSELMQKYVAKRAESTGGVTVNLGDQVNKELVKLNTEGLRDYAAYAKGGEAQAKEIDAASEVVFDALVGGGSSWIASLEGLARQAGVDLPGDFGSLTKRSQIERLINNEVLQAAGLIKGALSDKDLQFLQGSVGSLGDSPESIRVALKRLANKKRIAAQMVKRFSGANGGKALSEGLVDYAAFEDEISTELQLQNPNLFGASFIQSDGSVSPEIVNQLIQNPASRANIGDITAEAEAALTAALEKRMRELGMIQ